LSGKTLLSSKSLDSTPFFNSSAVTPRADASSRIDPVDFALPVSRSEITDCFTPDF
jgi:hypothetical protein